MSQRAILREILNEVFKVDSDLDAFCIDYFPNIESQFASGMTRQIKLNLLLKYVAEAELLSRLRDHSKETDRIYERLRKIEAIPEIGQPVVLKKNDQEITLLQEEISKLTVTIQHLRQVNPKIAEARISADKAHSWITNSIAEGNKLTLNPNVTVSQLRIWRHVSLEALEQSFGSIHSITTEFRTMFLTDINNHSSRAIEDGLRRMIDLLQSAEQILSIVDQLRYDEIAYLRRELSGCPLGEEDTLFDAVCVAARSLQGYSDPSPAQIMNAIRDTIKTHELVDKAYWWLCVYGVFRFKDIDNWWTGKNNPLWTNSVGFVVLANRGQSLFRQLASECSR